jgi:hypothetical protein
MLSLHSKIIERTAKYNIHYSLLSLKSTEELGPQKHLTKRDMLHCYMITATGDPATGCLDNMSISSNRLKTCQMQLPTWPIGQT